MGESMKIEGKRMAGHVKGTERRSWSDRLGRAFMTSPWVSLAMGFWGVYLITHSHGGIRVLWYILTGVTVLAFFDRAHDRGWTKKR